MSWRTLDLETATFDAQGLIPVIAQDVLTGRVLMQAFATRETLQETQTTGRMTYWSRSRNQRWCKGEESGHTQQVHGLYLDCDGDAVLALVQQTGPACHTQATTCFDQEGQSDQRMAGFLGELEALMEERVANPTGYTGTLVTDPSFVSAKILEEAEEVGQVLQGLDNEDTLEHEAADLLYHLLAGLHGAGINLRTVVEELQKRH